MVTALWKGLHISELKGGDCRRSTNNACWCEESSRGNYKASKAYQFEYEGTITDAENRINNCQLL
jgi:hypothetical protein